MYVYAINLQCVNDRLRWTSFHIFCWYFCCFVCEVCFQIYCLFNWGFLSSCFNLSVLWKLSMQFLNQIYILKVIYPDVYYLQGCSFISLWDHFPEESITFVSPLHEFFASDFLFCSSKISFFFFSWEFLLIYLDCSFPYHIEQSCKSHSTVYLLFPKFWVNFSLKYSDCLFPWEWVGS